MTTRVVVFGREPVPGQVKTRLAVTQGDERAAAAYAFLLDHTIDAAISSGFETVLSLADPPSQRWAYGLRVPYQVQHGADLGSRMANAFADHFADGAERVVVVGSDCPGVQPRHLVAAAAALADAAVVLGPASDGGYWLVAQRRPGVDMFSEIRWSAPTTFAATRARLGALKASWVELDELRDIDTATDLMAALKDQTVPARLRKRLRVIVTR